MNHIEKLFAVLLLIPLTSCGARPYYKVAPIDAVIVDAETNLPIEGAIVVANWQLEAGGLDGPRRKGQLEVKETITDKSGRFHFDGFTKLNLMISELRDDDPKIIIFKGGYDYGRSSNYYGLRYPGTDRKAAVNGEVVKLRKLTPVVFEKNVTYYSGLSVQIRPIVEDCEWNKIPRMILAMEAEKQRITKIEPNESVDIFPIEEIESFKGKCGSMLEFFRSKQG